MYFLWEKHNMQWKYKIFTFTMHAYKNGVLLTIQIVNIGFSTAYSSVCITLYGHIFYSLCSSHQKNYVTVQYSYSIVQYCLHMNNIVFLRISQNEGNVNNSFYFTILWFESTSLL